MLTIDKRQLKSELYRQFILYNVNKLVLLQRVLNPPVNELTARDGGTIVCYYVKLGQEIESIGESLQQTYTVEMASY